MQVLNYLIHRIHSAEDARDLRMVPYPPESPFRRASFDFRLVPYSLYVMRHVLCKFPTAERLHDYYAETF